MYDPDSKLYAYIKLVDDNLDVFDRVGTASEIKFNNGWAYIWPWLKYPGKWHLVIFHETAEGDVIPDDVYYGDEELIEDNCNDLRIPSEVLYQRLATLPKVNLNKFYGMAEIFDRYPEIFS